MTTDRPPAPPAAGFAFGAAVFPPPPNRGGLGRGKPAHNRVEPSLASPLTSPKFGEEIFVEWKLRNQHHGPGGLARFEVAVRLGGFFQRVGVRDLDLDPAFADGVDHAIRGELE